jgi:hypothetical protein
MSFATMSRVKQTGTSVGLGVRQLDVQRFKAMNKSQFDLRGPTRYFCDFAPPYGAKKRGRGDVCLSCLVSIAFRGSQFRGLQGARCKLDRFQLVDFRLRGDGAQFSKLASAGQDIAFE